MAEGLFREEVLELQRGRLAGEILLVQPLSHTVIAGVIAAMLGALFAFLYLGEYTRKEQAFGVVAPQGGSVRLAAPDSGVVRRKPVREGQAVTAGTLIFELEQARSSDLGETQALLENTLRDQRGSLGAEIGRRAMLARETVDALAKRADQLGLEVGHVEAEIRIQAEQVETSRRLAANLRPLFEEQIISEAQYQAQVGAHLEQQSRLEALRRQRLSLRGELEQTVSRERQERLRAQSEQAGLERNLSTNERELIQTRGTRLLQVKATLDGTVTGLLADVGQTVESGAPLATLIPAGGKLEVRLFVPSSAIGFVRPGQTVRLRYDAFPYQKFGQQSGTVSEVVSADIPGRDLLARYPQLADKGAAFFRVTVLIDRPHVQAYGQLFPLRPGMTVQADVQIERKRLIEWIFDPLLAMGRAT